MPERIQIVGWMIIKIISLGGVVVSTSVASVLSIATMTPLSAEDLEHLAKGDGQTVMAIMAGMLVIAILGLSGVIAHMFRVNEKRHLLGHAERDKREASFHALSEKMITVVAESNESRKETNQILRKFEETVKKSHDETILLKKGDVVKMAKDN